MTKKEFELKYSAITKQIEDLCMEAEALIKGLGVENEVFIYAKNGKFPGDPSSWPTPNVQISAIIDNECFTPSPPGTFK